MSAPWPRDHRRDAPHRLSNLRHPGQGRRSSRRACRRDPSMLHEQHADVFVPGEVLRLHHGWSSVTTSSHAQGSVRGTAARARAGPSTRQARERTTVKVTTRGYPHHPGLKRAPTSLGRRRCSTSNGPRLGTWRVLRLFDRTNKQIALLGHERFKMVRRDAACSCCAEDERTRRQHPALDPRSDAEQQCQPGERCGRQHHSPS